ncbi:hypothetical protein H2198_007003 [Neophaeococcomyces mojaviensis]|uniref:Uncharacterized protein n=1 Tax=Neophaeococcomyces mojaviensis TaxID=3383035 RepID=A0ACC3A1D2_9EURO|nr:hypothetical protein H2198_007003 [Knufia sp. JES_112]
MTAIQVEPRLQIAPELDTIEAKGLVAAPIVEPTLELRSPAVDDVLDADDDCVICYQTLYRPAKTECGHSACQSCMLHWAMTAMDACNDEIQLPSNFVVDGIRFTCPTCRTYTTAAFDEEQNARLQQRYPDDYASRAIEEATEASPDDEFANQNMVLMLGNSHRKVEPSISPYSGKIRTHEWTFFVQSSRQDVIEQVKVILHPTFRQDRLVILREPPFSTTHLGYGYFTIYAGIQLGEGWEWVDEPMAVNVDKTRKKATLPVEWLLDFRGNGSRKTQVVKFKKVKPEPVVDSEDESIDMSDLALVMSETEIAELRETIRARRAARKMVENLESATST